MQSPARRGFLTGRRFSSNPWEAFCQRVNRGIAGNLFNFGVQDGVGSARLTPKATADVRHARALCSEYDVVMALDGVNHADRQSTQSVLWVELGSDMALCEPLADDGSKWFVQPGCLLGELETAGFEQFTDLPSYLTVAAWLADRTLCTWASGETFKSGLSHASVLLADGTVATLGPFGEHNNQPLQNLSLQKLIPALFQMANQPDAQACRGLEQWPARYRLDALLPHAHHGVNLAHLLLGHGGDLGWVEWVVLDERAFIVPDPPTHFSLRGQAPDADAADLALGLDAQIKALFDPLGLFPHPGQDI